MDGNGKEFFEEEVRHILHYKSIAKRLKSFAYNDVFVSIEFHWGGFCAIVQASPKYKQSLNQKEKEDVNGHKR